MSEMKLRFTPNPNYIHKVLVAAAEAGVTDRLIYVRTGPFDADTDLWRDNPLNKVPTLVLDDGEALYGGPVICEYFDSLHDGPKMFPPWGRTRFTALTQTIRETMQTVSARLETITTRIDQILTNGRHGRHGDGD